MLATTHAITGALIASQATTSEIGFIAAIASHPLLDLFPHWDLHTRHSHKTKITIIWTSLLDAGIGFAIGWLLFKNTVSLSVLFVTMFLSQIFDWIEAPYHVFDWQFFPFATIKKIQHYWHSKLQFPWGLLPQLAILAAAIYLS